MKVYDEGQRVDDRADRAGARIVEVKADSDLDMDTLLEGFEDVEWPDEAEGVQVDMADMADMENEVSPAPMQSTGSVEV